MISNPKEAAFDVGKDLKEQKSEHAVDDQNKKQLALNLAFIRLSQTESNETREKLLVFLIDILDGQDVVLTAFQIQTLMRYFNDEVCDDDSVRSITASLLSLILSLDVEKYSTMYLSLGFVEIAKEYFTIYPDITAITATLLYASFDTCKTLVESGILDILKQAIMEYDETLKHLIGCIEGIAHYSAFENQLQPFVNILYQIIQMPENVNEYFEAVLSAFNKMATYSELLSRTIVSDPRFQSLIEHCFAVIDCEEEEQDENSINPRKMIVDSFICFIGGIISHPGILDNGIVGELIVRLCNLYKSTDIYYVKHALEALVKGCQLGPDYVQICIENDVPLHASILIQSQKLNFKDIELNAKLLFSLFLNSSKEQSEAFFNANITDIAFQILQTSEKSMPDMLLNVFLHLLQVAEATSNQDLIDYIVESEDVHEFVSSLMESQDMDLVYKATSLKELLEQD